MKETKFRGKSNVTAKNKTKKSVPAKNVDEYLASLPEDVMVMLEKIRSAIKSAAPKAEEKISYQIPTYKYHKPLIHFMAHKDYCSLIAVSKSILEKFKKELDGYDVSGTTIHFTADNPLPASLVKKIVKERIKENEARKK
ncbi:MAG: DUF1801 domain-containing protein [Ignavibacteriae bacterium]|nr:MAG: DUF1801 domain-containing protein [Ignavibacteriota bacterium]